MDKEELENAGIDYFAQLYGATSEEGEPQQTFFDKWRGCFWIRHRHQTFSAVVLSTVIGDVGVG